MDAGRKQREIGLHALNLVNNKGAKQNTDKNRHRLRDRESRKIHSEQPQSRSLAHSLTFSWFLRHELFRKCNALCTNT